MPCEKPSCSTLRAPCADIAIDSRPPTLKARLAAAYLAHVGVSSFPRAPRTGFEVAS